MSFTCCGSQGSGLLVWWGAQPLPSRLIGQSQNTRSHETRPLFTSRVLHLDLRICPNAPAAAYACILCLCPPFHAPLLYSPSPDSVFHFAGPDKLSGTSGDITSAPEVCKIHSLTRSCTIHFGRRRGWQNYFLYPLLFADHSSAASRLSG
jgi:hypothetical protein